MLSRSWVSKYTWVGQSRGRRKEGSNFRGKETLREKYGEEREEKERKEVKEEGMSVCSKPITFQRS